MSSASDALDRLTTLVPDFPQPGILFRDLTPVFADADALAVVARALTAPHAGTFDVVAGVEARGFVLAAAAAALTGTGMLPVRKAGKLPRPTASRDYVLEYGTATLEVQTGHLAAGTRMLLVDDLLATGGTLTAAAELLEESGLTLAGIAVAVELEALGGRTRLGDRPLYAIQSV